MSLARSRQDGNQYELWCGARQVGRIALDGGSEDGSDSHGRDDREGGLMAASRAAIDRARNSLARADALLVNTRKTIADTRELIERQGRVFDYLAGGPRMR